MNSRLRGIDGRGRSGLRRADFHSRLRGNDGGGAGTLCVRCRGVREGRTPMDSRLRGNDGEGVPAHPVRTTIPASVRTVIPASVRMTTMTLVRHSREGGNPSVDANHACQCTGHPQRRRPSTWTCPRQLPSSPRSPSSRWRGAGIHAALTEHKFRQPGPEP